MKYILKMTDNNDSISSFKTFIEFVNQEELCADIANTRLVELNEHLLNSEEVLNQSKRNIEDIFREIIVIINNWKKEFLKDLEESVGAQQEHLIKEREFLKENIASFKKFMFAAKVNLEACKEELREETALKYLDTLSPVIKLLIDESLYQPIEFVAKDSKTVFKPHVKNKIGYIQYYPIEIASLRLEPKQQQHILGSKAEFVVWVPPKYNLERISKYFTWNVSADGCNVPTSTFIEETTFCLEFSIIKDVAYKVSFFIFNQNIGGSPSTIAPKKAPVIFESLESKENLHHADSLKFLKSDCGSIHLQSIKDSNASIRQNEISNTDSHDTLHKVKKEAFSPQSPKAPVKLVSRTTTILNPPRALGQFKNRPSSVDVKELVKNVSVEKKNLPIENGIKTPDKLVTNVSVEKKNLPVEIKNGTKTPDKLVNRTTRINPTTMRLPLRKPFSQNKDAAVLTKDNVNLCRKEENPVDSEFKPGFSSTSSGEALSEKLKNLKIADVSLNDCSLEPGHKTLLLDEFVIKEECLSPQDNQYFDEMYDPSSIKQDPEDDNNVVANDGLISESKVELVKEEKREFIDNSSFHHFLQVDLTAKWQVCFLGTTEIKMSNPIGIAELRNGNIVVADTFNGRMLLFNSNAEFLTEFNGHKRLIKPSAVDLLPDGRFAVRDNKSITTFSPECQPLKVLGANFLKRPFGITHDCDGNIITVDTGLEEGLTIISMDSITGQIVKRVVVKNLVPSPDCTKSKPRFIAYQAPSTLFVVDLGLDQVYNINMKTGNLVYKFGGHGSATGKFNDPSGIVCDVDGYMFIGDSRNHRIQMFSPEGKFLSVLKVDRPLRRPSGLHLTAKGLLYVLNYWENSFVKYEFSAGGI